MTPILLALLAIAPSTQPPRTVYVDDTVWCFELNTVPRFNAATWEWEVGGQAYLFWDALPYPRIVDWRWRRSITILDEGPHHVVFVDKLAPGDCRVVRRLRFLLSWNSLTSKDKEVENRDAWPVGRRRGLSDQ